MSDMAKKTIHINSCFRDHPDNGQNVSGGDVNADTDPKTDADTGTGVEACHDDAAK